MTEKTAATDPRFTPDGRSNWQRMKDGDFYIADEPGFGQSFHRSCRLLNVYHQLFHTDPDVAEMVLRHVLGSVGTGVEIRPTFTVDYGENIYLGNDVFINSNCTFLDVADIRIGDKTLIGPNVQILTPTHPVELQPRLDMWEGAVPITIGNGVWIGGGAIICPGVTIGDGSVIGAGAVVTKEIPAGVIAVGNPAHVIRKVE